LRRRNISSPVEHRHVSTNSTSTTACCSPETPHRSRGISTVHGRFLASTSNQVRQAAIDGLGIALLTDLHVKPDVEDGRLVGVLDQYRSDETRFCAVFPDHRHIRRIATIFVEYIQGKLAAMQDK
jgi:DNA-binding transcriptional LysR family regulator